MARAVENCGATLVSATIGESVSGGFLPNQTTNTINTAQMTMNQKTERLIFISRQLLMLKPKVWERNNVCQ
jgi:hypothetical protein